MKILELFAGSRSIGRAAESLGHTVFSVDWEQFDRIDLCIDIEELRLDQIPFVPDLIWCSFDCTTYSVMAIGTHRDGINPKSDYAVKCDRVNQHVIACIKAWKKLNPALIYFFENPRGMLRKMPFMQGFKRYTVWYCQYGDSRAKPTDIWTNSKKWTPRKRCSNNNPNCTHDRSPRNERGGTQRMKNAYERSKIPTELCMDILHSFDKDEVRHRCRYCNRNRAISKLEIVSSGKKNMFFCRDTECRKRYVQTIGVVSNHSP